MGILAPEDDDDAADLSAPVEQPSSSSRGYRRHRDSRSDVDSVAASGRSVRPRHSRRDEPDRSVVDSLRAMLNNHNKLVKTFRMAEQRMFSPNAPEVGIRLFGHEGTEHGNRYSLPTAPELAALIVGDLDTERCRFDVIVQKHAGPLQRVSPLNPSLMSLQYLSSCESCWRTFAYDIHVREPSTERLTVHLPNMNRVIYHENDSLANIVQDPNRLLLEEMQYDRYALTDQAASLCSKLNQEQIGIYEQIMAAVTATTGKVFFVSGHGGTGKTFLWSAIVVGILHVCTIDSA
ncbi:hypothetical protein ACQ4PT_051140 [Festuca glaucescens]